MKQAIDQGCSIPPPCSRCLEMEQKLAERDETIRNLMQVLDHIHVFSAVNLPGNSTRISTAPTKISEEPCKPSTSSRSRSLSSLGSTPSPLSSPDGFQSSSSSSSHEDNGNPKSVKEPDSSKKLYLSKENPTEGIRHEKGSVITIQEIINRVVEKDSNQTGKAEDICDSFNKLLSALDSKSPSPKRKSRSVRDQSSGDATTEDQSNSDNEQSFVKRPKTKCTPLDLSAHSKPTSRRSTSAPFQSSVPFPSEYSSSPNQLNCSSNRFSSVESAFNDYSSRKRKSSYSLPKASWSGKSHRARREHQYYHHHHLVYLQNSLPFQREQTDSEEEFLETNCPPQPYGLRLPRDKPQFRKIESSNEPCGNLSDESIDIGIKVPKEICVSLVKSKI